MIDGVFMVFSAQKMIEGLEANGQSFQMIANMPGVLPNLKRLDGCEVTASCWARVVNGQPVFYVNKDKNGDEGDYVPDWACVESHNWSPCTYF